MGEDTSPAPTVTSLFHAPSPTDERLARQPGLARLVARAEAVDPSFALHSWSVAELSAGIGRALGLSADELASLALAAALHDVGKAAVPAGVLAKEGPLDEREWALVREHPTAGERLLRRYVDSPAVLAVVRSHHERWDGRGYPDGLAGEAIPLGARIVAVADAFAAMVEARCYRKARTRAAARAELLAQAGRQFDPRCARAAVAATAR